MSNGGGIRSVFTSTVPRFPAGYRLPRRHRFRKLADVLWTRRHERLNRRLYIRLDQCGAWPRNPTWRYTYDPLKWVFSLETRPFRGVIAAITLLASLSGCATSMICRPVAQDGTQRCDPVPYAPQRATGYSQEPEHEPGYAPAYPPLDAQPTRMQPPDRWVRDRPHWQPGDE